ncbi:hypothetical protein CC1G_08872 [Coprinopsis cinerea okayama7|uniref:F-box domain-containing protein n=1 Tax=Coprinopsis cinerea (strain Okayama-7 / 130 / ATCC MYA-4618 / FGSC 9003) TaxID=240176 RepID=A8P6F3_COPC7|nr:hypothetical protein CC1G_08872 [Coprinopsis cinerea okayama7\|eukprot:XP_001839146.1 hypothetical protein CC1G_08872 [Coprinopsis cinerea okayama7\
MIPTTHISLELTRSLLSECLIGLSEAHSTTNPKLEGLVTDILAQPRRLKSLHLSRELSNANEKRLREIADPAPLLQSLTIVRAYRSSGYTPSDSILPKTFLNGEAPNLRNLELNGYQLSWDSSLLRGLTLLKLTCMPHPRYRVDLQPSAETFFGALEVMESLRTLNLDTPLPASPLAKHRTVTLRHMENFRLKGSASDCANVMMHLVLPPSAALEFVVTKKTDEADQILADLTTSITNSWRSGGHLFSSSTTTIGGLKSMHVYTDRHTLLVRGYPRDAGSPGIRWGANNPPSLQFQVTASGLSATTNPIVRLLGGLPLDKVRTIALAGSINTSALEFFGLLPSLHTISVDRQSSAGFVKYITSDPALRPMVIKKIAHGEATPGVQKPNPRPAHLSYFRALKKLIFGRADFRSYAIDIDALLDFLMSRYELGGEIEVLELIGCIGLYEDDVKKLEEVVADVEWDKEVVDFYSDEEEEDECDYCGQEGCINCDDDYQPTIYDLLGY